jgi:hypothetical protein
VAIAAGRTTSVHGGIRQRRIGHDRPRRSDRLGSHRRLQSEHPGAIGANGTGSNAYAGTHAPDIVGNIRSIRPGVCCQFSAAAHEVNRLVQHAGRRRRADELFRNQRAPETKWGGAVMAALQVKNLPTGKGDDIKVDASFAKGATKYIISTDATSPNFAMFAGSGLATRASDLAPPRTAFTCRARSAPAVSS